MPPRPPRRPPPSSRTLGGSLGFLSTTQSVHSWPFLLSAIPSVTTGESSTPPSSSHLPPPPTPPRRSRGCQARAFIEFRPRTAAGGRPTPLGSKIRKRVARSPKAT